MNLFGFLAAATLAACISTSAMAATDTDTFDVTLTIVDACEVTADNDMAFGTQNFLDVAIDATADFTIQCTDSTVGTISLDQGLGTGGSFTDSLHGKRCGADRIRALHGRRPHQLLGRREPGFKRPLCTPVLVRKRH